MSESTVNRILAALLAVTVALKADFGTLPLEGDARAYIGWALSGVAAGLTVLLGPQLADAVRAALKGKDPTP